MVSKFTPVLKKHSKFYQAFEYNLVVFEVLRNHFLGIQIVYLSRVIFCPLLCVKNKKFCIQVMCKLVLACHAKQLELKAVGSIFSFKTVYVVRKTQ